MILTFLISLLKNTTRQSKMNCVRIKLLMKLILRQFRYSSAHGLWRKFCNSLLPLPLCHSLEVNRYKLE
jgi:hypothetical protein